jgi:hypothetical protein
MLNVHQDGEKESTRHSFPLGKYSVRLSHRHRDITVYPPQHTGNGVKILPRRGRYVESCTLRQNFNVLSRYCYERSVSSMGVHHYQELSMPLNPIQDNVDYKIVPHAQAKSANIIYSVMSRKEQVVVVTSQETKARQWE